MKKLGKTGKAIAIGGISLFITAAAGMGLYLNAPSNMFSIDVNPSIELHTNRLGYVVSVDPVNEDAKLIMAGYQLNDRDLETVIEDIVDRMILNGYLISEDTNQILITADEDISTDFMDKVDTLLTEYLQEMQFDVSVLDQLIDMNAESIEAAHDYEISVGKMAIIEKLLSENPNISLEDLVDESIKQLMQLAEEQGISPDNLITNYNGVAADQGSSADAVSSATTNVTEDFKVDEGANIIETSDKNDIDDMDTEDTELEDSEEDAEDSDDDKVTQKYRNEDSSEEDRDDADEEDGSYEDSQDEDGYDEDEDSDEEDDEDSYEEDEDSDYEDEEDADEQDWDEEDSYYNEDRDSEYEYDEKYNDDSYSNRKGDNEEDDGDQEEDRNSQEDEED